MKKLVLFIFTIAITTVGFSQKTNTINDQNPNHLVALEKYTSTNNPYILSQGTTAQNTYKAIDPMEEKRELKSLRKKHRANRRLWRHEERMERAKNTTYVEPVYNSGFYSPYFFNAGLQVFSLGLWGACVF